MVPSLDEHSHHLLPYLLPLDNWGLFQESIRLRVGIDLAGCRFRVTACRFWFCFSRVVQRCYLSTYAHASFALEHLSEAETWKSLSPLAGIWDTTLKETAIKCAKGFDMFYNAITTGQNLSLSTLRSWTIQSLHLPRWSLHADGTNWEWFPWGFLLIRRPNRASCAGNG